MTLNVRRIGLGLLASAILISFGLPGARAAELAGVMPAESVLYLEWSGTDAVRDTYATTAMGKTWAEPEMQRFAAELEKGINRLMVAPDVDGDLKQVGMGLQMVKPLLSHLLHHRVALSLIGTETTEQGPSLAAVLAIELGAPDDVVTFQGLINMATMQHPKQSETVGEYTVQKVEMPMLPPIRFGAVDDVFLVTVGAEVLNDVLAVKSGTAPGLIANERLAAARKKLGCTPANTTITVHLDLARAREQIKPLLLAYTGSEEPPPPVGQLLEELGINGIDSITYASQLANGGCRNATFIAAKAPRKGLLELYAGKPLADEDFHAVPADAPFVSVFNVDLPAVYDEALRIATVFAPEQVSMISTQFEENTGVKLREDVIALLDDGWTVFDAPSFGGFWFTGFNVVLETTDADAFVTMLDNLAGAIRKMTGDDGLSLSTCERNGHTVHYVTVTAGPVPVAPAWGAHGKRVVLALFPQMVAQTLDLMAAPDVAERCILANADFARGRKLMPAESIAITYIDTKRGATDLYKVFLPAATAGCSFAAANGIKLDVATIPTQATMTRHLFANVHGISHDEDGIISAGHGPLPIPLPSIAAGSGVAGTALMVSILLPSLTRARDLSKRLVSTTNLRGIGQACMLYAFEHHEEFPPDLETLVTDGSITRKMLISPLDPLRSRDDAAPGECSYFYIAGQTMKSDPSNVLAYEPDYDGEGGNVLFVDGHVEWATPARRQQVVDKTHERLEQEKATGE